jgi:hypothetical protein
VREQQLRADTLCQAEANAAGLPAQTYRAWLSSPFLSAAVRISRNAPFMTPNRMRVANSLSDLTDGNIANPINIHADGGVADASFTAAVTGTDTTGGPTGSTCGGNWSDQAGFFTYGYPLATNFSWTIQTSAMCGFNMLPVYCMRAQ